MYLFIRKRKEKYCVMLEYRKQDGSKAHKTIASYDKKKDADRKLIEEKNNQYNNDFIMPRKLTTFDYLITWANNRKHTLSITTYNRYIDIIERDIKNTIGRVELQKLTPLHIERFYINLTERLSNKTILQYHRLLHKAFADAYKKQLVGKNVFTLVEAPKPEKYKANYLTIDEIFILFDKAKNTRLEIPIHLAVSLGLRAGEILGLTWDKIDFKNNIITIDKTAAEDKKEKKIVMKETKSASSDRVITVPIGLMNLLKTYKDTKKIISRENLVFTTVDGQPMRTSSFSRMFRTFLEKNDLKKVRFHDLRHTNASVMLKAGISAKVSSERLGHSTIGITMDLYTHILQELDNEAAIKVDNLLYM